MEIIGNENGLKMKIEGNINICLNSGASNMAIVLCQSLFKLFTSRTTSEHSIIFSFCLAPLPFLYNNFYSSLDVCLDVTSLWKDFSQPNLWLRYPSIFTYHLIPANNSSYYNYLSCFLLESNLYGKPRL